MDYLHRALPFLTLLLVWLVLYLNQNRQRARSEARRDVQLALLNKFETGEQITTFLATAEGRQLLDEIGGPQEDPRQKTIGLAIGGCILSSIAAGFAILSAMRSTGNLLIPAAVIGATGIGLFIAAAVTYNISKKLGLSPKDK